MRYLFWVFSPEMFPIFVALVDTFSIWYTVVECVFV